MKDRFSENAKKYAQFRPLYPAALYEFIFSHTHRFDCAWDAGTGNGQAAKELAKKFTKVIATDISAAQIENAIPADNLVYQVAGETTTIPAHSIDLITVAQAAHWFDMKKFSEEAVRVSKPEAMIAVWGYGLLQLGNQIDEPIHHFYKGVIGPYWDAERKHIDEHYRNIYFPFQQIAAPSFGMTYEWTLEELEGYLNTWSAVRNYRKRKVSNPVPELIDMIGENWGVKQMVTFPLFLKLGKVHG
jgi:SAM-dependent methyltransferase